jgi:hypothetical protein
MNTNEPSDIVDIRRARRMTPAERLIVFELFVSTYS